MPLSKISRETYPRATIAERPDEDPTAGRDVGEPPFEDPTEEKQVGERPDEETGKCQMKAIVVADEAGERPG